VGVYDRTEAMDVIARSLRDYQREFDLEKQVQDLYVL